MTVFAIVVGAGSLILGTLAIWLTLHFKGESDKVNKDTRDLLVEIRSKAQLLSDVTMPELRAYGEVSRRVLLGNVPSMDNVSMSVLAESEASVASQPNACPSQPDSEEYPISDSGSSTQTSCDQ